MAKPKGSAKTGGRKPGTPNKIPALLKDAIIEAATNAGGKAGMVGYLQDQADKNPGPFLGLLGKVLPLQITGAVGITITVSQDDQNLA